MSRAPAWLRRARPDVELAAIREELEAHVAALRDEHVAAGDDPETAERRARARFGDFDAHVLACAHERPRRAETMRTTLILLSLLLVASMALHLLHARAVHEEAARAHDRAQELLSYRARAAQDLDALTAPRPVVYDVGDRLRVADLAAGAFDAEVRVAEDGMVLLPHVGWLRAHGKERSAFEEELTALFGDWYQQVEVVVERLD